MNLCFVSALVPATAAARRHARGSRSYDELGTGAGWCTTKSARGWAGRCCNASVLRWRTAGARPLVYVYSGKISSEIAPGFLAIWWWIAALTRSLFSVPGAAAKPSKQQSVSKMGSHSLRPGMHASKITCLPGCSSLSFRVNWSHSCAVSKLVESSGFAGENPGLADSSQHQGQFIIGISPPVAPGFCWREPRVFGGENPGFCWREPRFG